MNLLKLLIEYYYQVLCDDVRKAIGYAEGDFLQEHKLSAVKFITEELCHELLKNCTQVSGGSLKGFTGYFMLYSMCTQVLG